MTDEPLYQVVPKDQLKPSLREALDILNAHEANGTLQGLFYVADTSAPEGKCSVGIIEDMNAKCQMTARALLMEYGRWGPPPGEGAPNTEQLIYFLQRTTSDLFRGLVSGIAVVIIDSRRPDDPGVAAVCLDDASRDVLVRELHNILLQLQPSGGSA